MGKARLDDLDKAKPSGTGSSRTAVARHLGSAMARWGREWAPVLVIIVGGPWAFYQFWYKELWLPNTVPAVVNVGVTLTSNGSNGRLIPIQGSVTATNPGDREANVVAAWYIAEGVVLKRDTLSDPEFAKRVSDGLVRAEVTNRVVRDGERKPLSTGRLLTLLGSMKPKGSSTLDFVTFAPRDSFDLIRLYALVVTQPRYSRVAPNWQVVGGGWLSMKFAGLTGRGPMGGEYVELDPNDRRLQKLGLSAAVAYTELALPRTSGEVGQ